MDRWVAVAATVAAILSALVLIGQFLNARAQGRRDEVRLLLELSGSWNSLRSHWNVALMTVRGAEAYYLEVSAAELNRYRDALGRFDAAQDAADRAIQLSMSGRSVTEYHEWVESMGGQGAVRDHPELEMRIGKLLEVQMAIWGPANRQVTQARAELAEYRTSVRSVLRFLAEVSGLILRGRIPAELVYEAMGTEIARNAGALRSMMASEDQHGWVAVEPGLRARVLVLVDLLWAEAARLDELRTEPSPQSAAITKRQTGTGPRNRARCRNLARKLGGLRTARKLTRLLKCAETPATPYDWDGNFPDLVKPESADV